MLGTARGKGSSKALRRKALAVFWDLQGPVRMRRKTGGEGVGGAEGASGCGQRGSQEPDPTGPGSQWLGLGDLLLTQPDLHFYRVTLVPGQKTDNKGEE